MTKTFALYGEKKNHMQEKKVYVCVFGFFILFEEC